MDRQPLPGLSVKKIKAIEKLKERIEKGEAIFNQNILDENSLEAARHIFSLWQDLNYDILINLFKNKSIADSYALDVGAVLNGRASLEEKTNWFEKDLRNDLHKLESILERVNYISEDNLSKKQLVQNADTVILKDTLQKNVKRGKESWDFIYLVYGIILAIEFFAIGILPLSWINKIIIFIIAFLISTWLCIFNAWFQNKLIGLKIRIENTWKKL